MANIVNCADVGIKRLKVLTTHRKYVDKINEYVTQLQYFK